MTAAARLASAPQQMRALKRANEVRLAKAELTVAEVVLTCPWEAQSMTIADLLMSQRRWGVTRCRKLLQYVPMSETKEIGSMTTRQRHALAELLEASASERHELARQPLPSLSIA